MGLRWHPVGFGWPLDWNEIRADLVIGSCPRVGRDMEIIADQAKATAVLSLQEDRCRVAAGVVVSELRAVAEHRGVLMHNVPLRDFDPEHQRRHLVGAVRALQGLLDGGHRVYVHCTAGVNRAPLVVLGVLTFVEGEDYVEALDSIELRREVAPYKEAWMGCRADVLAPRLAEAPPDRDDRHQWERRILREACLP